MRRLEHNGVHSTKKGAMHPDPVSDAAATRRHCGKVVGTAHLPRGE
jgi:hypothetical protein